MSAQRLLGKRVLVTGAGRGIGQAIAILCSDEGAKVAITSRTEKELVETSSKMGNEASLHITDVTNGSQVQAMVDAIVAKWGGIDILINNAGGASSKGTFDNLDSDEFSQLLTLNVVAVHRVTSAVVKHMPEGSHVVNISSRAGKVGIPTMSFYVASKFALEGLSATMAEEMKDKKIQVNTISPGMVDTKSFPKAPGNPKVRTPDSIKDGLFALLESSVTGHYLHVDELDLARERGLEDSAALKRINEIEFDP